MVKERVGGGSHVVRGHSHALVESPEAVAEEKEQQVTETAPDTEVGEGSTAPAKPEDSEPDTNE